MKAIVIHGAKDLRIEERPVEDVGPGQVDIAVEAGGICGSDLHYYNHGGFGTVRLREPMILGHEVGGTVKTLGEGVSSLAVGDRVAVSPSRPCNACCYCLSGQQNHCLKMRFYGSAMPMPHIQGAFRQSLVAEEWQCHKVADGVSINEAGGRSGQAIRQLGEPIKAFALGLVLRACPEVAMYGPNGGISSWRELMAAASTVRSMLGVSPSAYQDACDVLGPEMAAAAIACILERGGHINSAGGYLRDLTRRAEKGEFSVGPMLMALVRANGGAEQKTG